MRKRDKQDDVTESELHNQESAIRTILMIESGIEFDSRLSRFGKNGNYRRCSHI